jgi:hypothetical protein
MGMGKARNQEFRCNMSAVPIPTLSLYLVDLAKKVAIGPNVRDQKSQQQRQSGIKMGNELVVKEKC